MKLFTEKEANSLITDDTVLLSDTQLRGLQMAIYQIAKDIIAFCNAHNLLVHLSGGTALGAVRHQGFIPWDDDMDLHMPRKDYDWFVTHFSEEYGEKYWLSAENYEYRDAKETSIIKVVKKGTVYRRLWSEDDKKTGIWVDVLAVENTYDNPILRKLHGYGCYILTGAVACKAYNQSWKRTRDAYRRSSVFRVLQLKKNLGYLLLFIPYNNLKRMQAKWFALCHNDQSECVVIPSGRGKFFGEIYNRKAFFETTEIMFEDKMWPITKDYVQYLKHLYGKDFMELPPLEKRERHAAIELKY